MGYVPNHKRIRETYNPRPNAQEARFEDFLSEEPCMGCGVFGVERHHVLMPAPGKRWRRDHRYQVALCADCHRGPQGVHGIGSEAKWCEINGKDTVATAERLWEAFLRMDRRKYG